jgi:chromosome segregation ATPase
VAFIGWDGISEEIHPLTVAGAAQVGLCRVKRLGALLPVELRHANHTASTNTFILRLKSVTKPYNSNRMPSASQIDQIADRVERLLVRYEELQRTNVLLAQQVESLTQERDSLKSRLSAARARVDALLERLPEIKVA